MKKTARRPGNLFGLGSPLAGLATWRAPSVLTIVIWLASVAAAQGPAIRRAETTADRESSIRLQATAPSSAAPAAPAPRLIRDPTQPSPPLREAIEASQAGPGTGPTGAPALPTLALRARIVGRSTRPVAVIAVGEKTTLTVRPDVDYSVPYPGGPNLMLRVVSITASEVEVELLPLGRRVVLQ